MKRGLTAYLAPRGADPEQDATGSLDHSLEILILVGETEAHSEGADNVGGGLSQQQGGVKWLSWWGGGKEECGDGIGEDRLHGGQKQSPRERHQDRDRQTDRDRETDKDREKETNRDTDRQARRETEKFTGEKNKWRKKEAEKCL